MQVYLYYEKTFEITVISAVETKTLNPSKLCYVREIDILIILIVYLLLLYYFYYWTFFNDLGIIPEED